MADPHAAPVVEIDDFGRLPEAQHVGRQHSIPLSKCGYRSLPADFGADAELATVQQDHRVAVAGFQVTGDQPVDHELFALHPLLIPYPAAWPGVDRTNVNTCDASRFS